MQKQTMNVRFVVKVPNSNINFVTGDEFSAMRAAAEFGNNTLTKIETIETTEEIQVLETS